MPALSKTRSDIAYKTDDMELMDLIADRRYIPILLLSSHIEGTNEDEIRFFFGQDAALRFAELVDAGNHLTHCGASNWRLTQDIGAVDLETTREWLAVMASICPIANDHFNRSSLAHVGFESVNFETALAIYHAALDFARTTAKLISNQSNRGDILVIFGSLFNILKGTEAFQ